MNVKGIEPPTSVELPKESKFYRWIVKLQQVFPKVQTFQIAVTPTAVSANSESVQTITVSGVSTTDAILINKPTNQTDLDLVHVWASATDTVSVKYRNYSGSPITPTAESYLIVAIRL